MDLYLAGAARDIMYGWPNSVLVARPAILPRSKSNGLPRVVGNSYYKPFHREGLSEWEPPQLPQKGWPRFPAALNICNLTMLAEARCDRELKVHHQRCLHTPIICSGMVAQDFGSLFINTLLHMDSVALTSECFTHLETYLRDRWGHPRKWA